MQISKIQILPMSESGFDKGKNDLNSIQFDYLLKELPLYEEGRYYYETSGITEPHETLILFKFNTEIIGMGILLDRNQDSYGKYLQFDSSSISIFTKPISVSDMTYIWPDFKEYGQSKKILNIQYLNKFLDYFSNRVLNVSSDDLFQIQIELLPETNTKIIDKPIPKTQKNNSNSQYYQRDPNVSKRAVRNSEYHCELSREHKSFVSKYTDKNYVEAHHFIPLEFQDKFDNSLDVEANIISLCPICHKMMHFSKIDKIKDSLLEIWELRKPRLEKCGLFSSFEELMKYYN